MASVKRYDIYRHGTGVGVSSGDDGKYVLSSDYDKLCKVMHDMRDWLVFATDETLGLPYSCDREDLKDFLALIGEGGEEGK